MGKIIESYEQDRCHSKLIKKCNILYTYLTSLSSQLAPQNVVTVPPNCRPGQQWVNGSCRDVWRSGTDSKNVITVPTNCPDGQVFINMQCREVWRSALNLENAENQLKVVEIQDQNDGNRNVITVPNQCPSGYRPDALGNCRPIWSINLEKLL